jgi:hypothetical protein
MIIMLLNLLTTCREGDIVREEVFSRICWLADNDRSAELLKLLQTLQETAFFK